MDNVIDSKGVLRRHKFRSNFEFKFAQYLIDEGIKFEYEPHDKQISYVKPVRFGLCKKCGSAKVGTQRSYCPDFYLPDYDIYIETKGRFKPQDRTKHKSIKECNPSIDLRFVFMSNNKLHPASNTRYMDWAETNGFKSALKVIPQEWMLEETDG